MRKKDSDYIDKMDLTKMPVPTFNEPEKRVKKVFKKHQKKKEIQVF